MRFVLVILLLSIPALSGCVSETLGPEPRPEEGSVLQKARVTGKVVDAGIQGIEDAIVLIVQGDVLIGETTTDPQGHYKLEEVPPGRHILQVQHECCVLHMENLRIGPGETQTRDIQLEPEPSLHPYQDEREWNGFIACGLVAYITLSNDCGDPNHDTDHTFEVEEGLRTLLVTLDWDVSNGLQSDELHIRVERHYAMRSTYQYASQSGPPPIELRINATGHDTHSFEAIDDETWDLGIKVRPSGSMNTAYQQPFAVRYEMHYWQEAQTDERAAPGT